MPKQSAVVEGPTMPKEPSISDEQIAFQPSECETPQYSACQPMGRLGLISPEAVEHGDVGSCGPESDGAADEGPKLGTDGASDEGPKLGTGLCPEESY